MSGLPGICRKCRRAVTWNGVYWVETIGRAFRKHICPEIEAAWQRGNETTKENA